MSGSRKWPDMALDSGSKVCCCVVRAENGRDYKEQKDKVSGRAL